MASRASVFNDSGTSGRKALLLLTGSREGAHVALLGGAALLLRLLPQAEQLVEHEHHLLLELALLRLHLVEQLARHQVGAAALVEHRKELLLQLVLLGDGRLVHEKRDRVSGVPWRLLPGGERPLRRGKSVIRRRGGGLLLGRGELEDALLGRGSGQRRRALRLERLQRRPGHEPPRRRRPAFAGLSLGTGSGQTFPSESSAAISWLTTMSPSAAKIASPRRDRKSVV